jgi:hypothetical protein
VDRLDEVVQDKVRQLLAANKTMFLSTSASDSPWVAGTFFAESDLFRLTMILETTGKSLANIQANRKVAIVVSSGSAFEPFLQGEGEAVVLYGDGDIDATKNALLAKAPEIEPLLRFPVAAVTLDIRRWRATDVLAGWVPGKVLMPQMDAAPA